MSVSPEEADQDFQETQFSTSTANGQVNRIKLRNNHTNRGEATHIAAGAKAEQTGRQRHGTYIFYCYNISTHVLIIII